MTISKEQIVLNLANPTWRLGRYSSETPELVVEMIFSRFFLAEKKKGFQYNVAGGHHHQFQVSDGKGGYKFPDSLPQSIPQNEIDCYAAALAAVKTEGKVWFDPGDGIGRATQEDHDKCPTGHPLGMVLFPPSESGYTDDYRAFFNKGAYHPSVIKQYKKWKSGSKKAPPNTVDTEQGFIYDNQEIYLKEAHATWKAHGPYQRALENTLSMMIQEWESAKPTPKPDSWQIDAMGEMRARALDVILDQDIPINSSGPDGRIYAFFRYYQRAMDVSKEKYQSCWSYGFIWPMGQICNDTATGGYFPGWGTNFLQRWGPYWNAVKNGVRAKELGILDKDEFITKVLKRINQVSGRITHAAPGQSKPSFKLHEKLEWPRASGVNSLDHWVYRPDPNSSPNPVVQRVGQKGMLNVNYQADGQFYIGSHGSAQEQIYNTKRLAYLPPSDAFFGSPHKTMINLYAGSEWPHDSNVGTPIYHNAPVGVYRDKFLIAWRTPWYEKKRRANTNLHANNGQDSATGDWNSHMGFGLLCFNFNQGIWNSAKLKKDYKVYDAILWDRPENGTITMESIHKHGQTPKPGELYVGFDQKDMKKLLTEWFAKNPKETLYGVDSATNVVPITKNNFEKLAMQAMNKIVLHRGTNKKNWDKFFDPQPSYLKNIDDSKFNLKDSGGYGAVIRQAYDEGYSSFFANHDAWYFQAAPFGGNPATEARKMTRHRENWAFDRKNRLYTNYNPQLGPINVPLEKGLMNDLDKTYDSKLHHWDDSAQQSTERAKFKIEVENIFVNQTAYALLAFYIGHAKMEFQESFIIEILKQPDLTAPPLDPDAIATAEKDALEDLNKNGITSETPTPGAQTLSDEEIEARQKFFKQCALLLNLEQFVAAHRLRLYADVASKKRQTIHNQGGGPYGGRFWMLEDKGSESTDQASIINKLFINNDLYQFMNIPQPIVAMLVPKLRLYQVYNSKAGIDKGDQLVEVEFEFQQEGLGNHDAESGEMKSMIDRINDLHSEEYDKGGGVGIKSFAFSYEGTTPATARNDIVCDLSLYFQSFNDFFKTRINSITKRQYQFVDLVLYPDNKKRMKKDKRVQKRKKTGAKNEYDPADYRIRADVGWVIPSEYTRDQINSIARAQGLITGNEDYYDGLVRIIKTSNKSFYLNMVDHKMDIKDTGGVQLDINYRAYVETALKSNRFNALLDENTYRLKQTQQDLLDDARKRECTTQDFMILRREIDRQNELITKNAHQSILRRLIKRGKIYFVDVADADKAEFERRGYFPNRPTYVNYRKQSKSGYNEWNGNTKKKADELLKKSDINKKNFALLDDDWVDENLSKNVRVNYFFMGDLIYTILDVLEIEPDLEKTRLLLSSFEYIDYDGTTRIANIADIPVSCDYFFEWYTQHVIKPKKQSFPIAYFVRTLCNHFITELLSDRCRNKSQVLKTRFTSGTFMAAPNENDQDPFRQMVFHDPDTAGSFNPDSTLVQVAKYYNAKGPLPLTHYEVPSVSSMAQSFYQYMLVHGIVSPMMNHPGVGDEIEDRKRGVHHIHIGGQTGIIKKVSFAKTDIQYIRESRFLNQGDDGLLQLGAVYKATIDMVGNTLWFPGMELYINPLGIGGLQMGFPNDSNSAANKLGLGGYHLITRIKSSIVPGSFNTQIEAQFHYSGDKTSGKQRLGNFGKKEEEKSVADQRGTISDNCRTILESLEAGTAQLKVGYKQSASKSSYSQKNENRETNAEKVKTKKSTINNNQNPTGRGTVSAIKAVKGYAHGANSTLGNPVDMQLEQSLARKNPKIEKEMKTYNTYNKNNNIETVRLNTSIEKSKFDQSQACFAAHTLITMADMSEVKIADIKVGDLVMTIDGPQPVLEIYSPLHDDLYDHKFDNGKTITCTSDHPLYVVDKGWCSMRPDLSYSRYGVKSKQLEIMDKMAPLATGEVRLLSSTPNPSTVMTYTFSTYSQTYYAEGLLAHSEI